MTDDWITCSMCGEVFDPQAHAACRTCPLHNGCQLVCCPVCGYQTIDLQRSRLAQLALRWVKSNPKAQRSKAGRHTP